MRRPRLAVWAVAASAVALLSLSCAEDNPTSMVILGNLAPASDSCSYEAAEEGPFKPIRYDVVSAWPSGEQNLGLTVHFVVKSLLADDPNGQPRVINFGKARVVLRAVADLDSQDLIAALSAQGATVRDQAPISAASLQPGDLGIYAVNLLDPGQRSIIEGAFPAGAPFVQVEAEVTLRGTANTVDVESAAFTTTITIFKGGLIRDRGSCTNPDLCGQALDVGGCEPFSDAMDCCERDGVDYCPASLAVSCMMQP